MKMLFGLRGYWLLGKRHFSGRRGSGWSFFPDLLLCCVRLFRCTSLLKRKKKNSELCWRDRNTWRRYLGGGKRWRPKLRLSPSLTRRWWTASLTSCPAWSEEGRRGRPPWDTRFGKRKLGTFCGSRRVRYYMPVSTLSEIWGESHRGDRHRRAANGGGSPPRGRRWLGRVLLLQICLHVLPGRSHPQPHPPEASAAPAVPRRRRRRPGASLTPLTFLIDFDLNVEYIYIFMVFSVTLSPGFSDCVVDHPEVHGRPAWSKEAGPGSGRLPAGTTYAAGVDVQKRQTSQPHGWTGSGKCYIQCDVILSD